MRELDVFRETLERQGRLAVGTNPLSSKVTQGAARTATLDSLMARLPIETDELAPLQDYATGVFFVMVGISTIGGDDVLA